MAKKSRCHMSLPFGHTFERRIIQRRLDDGCLTCCAVDGGSPEELLPAGGSGHGPESGSGEAQDEANAGGVLEEAEQAFAGDVVGESRRGGGGRVLWRLRRCTVVPLVVVEIHDLCMHSRLYFLIQIYV